MKEPANEVTAGWVHVAVVSRGLHASDNTWGVPALMEKGTEKRKKKKKKKKRQDPGSQIQKNPSFSMATQD